MANQAKQYVFDRIGFYSNRISWIYISFGQYYEKYCFNKKKKKNTKIIKLLNVSMFFFSHITLYGV